MKILKYALFASLFFVVTSARSAEVDYWRSDSVKVVRLLREAPHQNDSNQMLYFARRLRGLPYVAKTLEKNEHEKLVVNLRQFDCTTFVETVLALTRCVKEGKRTFEAFCDNLRNLRYRNGEVTYVDRLHYFTAWIEDNERMGLVKEIQGPNPPFSAVQTVKVNYMTTHRSLYPMMVRHPEWVKGIRKMEDSISGRRYKYIPKSMLTNYKALRQCIDDGDVIVILTKKKGLDTSHLAIAVWHDDGLHFIDASMVQHKVVEESMTIAQYMARHPSHIGIRVVRSL
jgi:hypothetical protein